MEQCRKQRETSCWQKILGQNYERAAPGGRLHKLEENCGTHTGGVGQAGDMTGLGRF